jgi:transcriptional regulator with XRE-family HTH domain
MAKFNERIKELRAKNNMTMEELGNVIGKGKSTIAGYESGARRPKMHNIRALADHFKVSIDYLLGHTDNPIPTKHSKNLAVLLAETDDYHYNGVPVSQQDLELLNSVLERIAKNSDNDNNNELITTRDKKDK